MIGIGYSLSSMMRRIARHDRGMARLVWIVAIGALVLGAAIIAAVPQGVPA